MRKFLFLTILFFWSASCYAGISVCSDQNGNVTSFKLRGNSVQGCDYYDIGQNVDSSQYASISSLLKTVSRKYLKMVNGFPEEMSQSEKNAVDAAQASANTAAVRTGAKNSSAGFYPDPLYRRALADVLVDEINNLRKWTRDFKTEVAAATNLANLQSRVATLPTLNGRTLSQLKTSIDNKIDSGSVD